MDVSQGFAADGGEEHNSGPNDASPAYPRADSSLQSHVEPAPHGAYLPGTPTMEAPAQPSADMPPVAEPTIEAPRATHEGTPQVADPRESLTTPPAPTPAVPLEATHAAQVPAETIAWQVYQRPSSAGRERQDSIQVATSAMRPSEVQAPDVITRFELRPGDLYDSSGYVASRAEVYGRLPTPSSTAPSEWPDPVGSTRWYGVRLFVPDDFQTTDDTSWIVVTQWKGLRGGSPPLALEIKRDSLRLGGARTNAGLIPNDGSLGPLRRGQWTTLHVGISLSPDPMSGWVEVWRDGAQLIPRTSVATMDTIGGVVDPIYIKQGIYRGGPAWSETTHVLYFGPSQVASTREALQP